MKLLSLLFGNSSSSFKPYKIEIVNGGTRIGIIAKSIQNLRKECIHRLKLPGDNFSLVLASDGTEVDEEDYFSSLPPQTCFVVLQPGEIWLPDVHSSTAGLGSALSTLLHDTNNKTAIIDELRGMQSTCDNPVLASLIGNIATHVNTESNISTQTKKEDPQWFKGVDDRFSSKEEVMKDAARRRIRSYLYTAKDFVKENCTKDAKSSLNLLLSEFEKILKKRDFYADLFARCADDASVRICDKDGWFHCEGLYNQSKCDYFDHTINPYASHAARVLFSTWNLDHRIEKSREVLPSLVHALTNIPSYKKLNWMYFFNLLFTRENLRIVHIVCHDKKEHDATKCDTTKFYH